MHEVFLIHLFVTWLLAGMTWGVQIIHLPLMEHVAENRQQRFNRAYQARSNLLYIPLMLVELITAILILNHPSDFLVEDMGLFYFSLILVASVWIVHLFVLLPLHLQLHSGFSPRLLHALITINWVRTFAWSLRSVLLFYIQWYLW